jgi:Flp pilus assembly protein TadG
MIATVFSLIRRLRRDQSGVSALEFALIAPLMILFYFGSAELTQAVMAQRRTLSVASAIGDLVAQANGTTTAQDVDDAMNMGNIIMYPFPTTGTVLSICVEGITADNSATPVKSVMWRHVKNDDGNCAAVGTKVTGLSDDVIAAGQSLIMARVAYKYTSSTNLVLHINPIFTKVYYLRPRRSSSISCTDAVTGKTCS